MQPSNPYLPYYETIRVAEVTTEVAFTHRVSRSSLAHRVVASVGDGVDTQFRVKFDDQFFGSSDAGTLYDALTLFGNNQFAVDMPSFAILKEGEYLRGRIAANAECDPHVTFHGIETGGRDLREVWAAYTAWQAVLDGDVSQVPTVLAAFGAAQHRTIEPWLPGTAGLERPRWHLGVARSTGNIAASGTQSISYDVGQEMTVFRIVYGDEIIDPGDSETLVELQFGLDGRSQMNMRDGTTGTIEAILARRNFGTDQNAGNLGFPLHFTNATAIRGTWSVPAGGTTSRPQMIPAGFPGPPEVAIPAYAVSLAAKAKRYRDPVPWMPRTAGPGPRFLTVGEGMLAYLEKGL